MARPSDERSNTSDNPSIHDLCASRRTVLQGSLGWAVRQAWGPLAAAGSPGALGPMAATLAAATTAGCATGPDGGQGQGVGERTVPRPRLGFRSVPPDVADRLVVPEGYVAQVLAPWGEPVGLPGEMPAFRMDAGNSAAEQAQQLGMHHDGLHYFPLEAEPSRASRRGLLAINHEYTDDGLLHPGGMADWTLEKVRKAQASHGIAVVEIERRDDGGWALVRPSPYARRVTAHTPCRLQGPVAGHPLVRTAADPEGRTVLGTLSNCAAGMTPWGTFLSGEENWKDYFDAGDTPTADQRRWGAVLRRGWYRWGEHDPRFDLRANPNEFHRFGWVVELDPMDPGAPPIKRTALGRAAHEGAWVAVTRDGRAVVYSGEDAYFEYLYKFVSRDRIAPARPGVTAAQANRELLDHGTLYVARFDADGTGRWLPLVHGQGPLTAANGFADQAEVLVKARQASDALGATKMDRPEWLAIDAARGEVYCTLTNNSKRGELGQPAVNAANPRAHNVMGQIIRWKEAGDFDGATMRWDHLLLAGDPANARPEARGNIVGDFFACPDGLYLDPQGLLWIECDVAPNDLHQGEMARIGNNQMLACDLATGEVRRFLTGPRGCEITGAAMTPDCTTLFINVQHPGESPSGRNHPARPQQHSSWPDHRPGLDGGRPRSATVAIRRLDGGRIGV